MPVPTDVIPVLLSVGVVIVAVPVCKDHKPVPGPGAIPVKVVVGLLAHKVGVVIEILAVYFFPLKVLIFDLAIILEEAKN